MSCIIECNGLPGCGKTSLAERLAARLRADGEEVRVRGVGEFRGEGIRGARRALLLPGRASALLQRGGLRAAAGGFFPEKRKSSAAAFLTGRERLITVMYLFYLLREYRGAGQAAVVTDEGLIQTLAVISFWQDIRGSAFAGARSVLASGRVFCIDCLLSPGEARARIEARGRKDSAMDSLRGEGLSAYLEAYASALRGIRPAAAARMSADMRRAPDEIAADTAAAVRRVQ